ncbi:MAG: EamA family transporter, partial [Beijerinckiaceae bacterium]
MSSQPAPSTLKAALWMGGWLAAMVAMAVAGRKAAVRLDAFQVMELRAIIAFILLQPLVFMAGGWRAMWSSQMLRHVLRNTIHYSGQYMWLVALTLIPLSQVVSIEFTMPIWTALLAVAFLGEKMNRWKSAAILLGLIGVWIIIRP